MKKPSPTIFAIQYCLISVQKFSVAKVRISSLAIATDKLDGAIDLKL